jgi:hypothetical protein
VRTIASSSHYYTSDDDYFIRQVNGPIALIDSNGSNQYATTSGTYVANIRNGRRYTIAATCGGFACGPTSGPVAQSAYVTSRGKAVAANGDNGNVEILAFTAKGERTVLDTGTAQEIPPHSLSLEGGTATWTHSGQPRSAEL